MQEMRESLSIIYQCLNNMPLGNIMVDDYTISPPTKADMINSMSMLINRFKHYSENIYFKQDQSYTSVESPKGEFGVFFCY